MQAGKGKDEGTRTTAVGPEQIAGLHERRRDGEQTLAGGVIRGQQYQPRVTHVRPFQEQCRYKRITLADRWSPANGQNTAATAVENVLTKFLQRQVHLFVTAADHVKRKAQVFAFKRSKHMKNTLRPHVSRRARNTLVPLDQPT